MVREKRKPVTAGETAREQEQAQEQAHAADIDVTGPEFRMSVFYTSAHTRHNQDPAKGWHTYDLPYCIIDGGASINIISKET